MNLCATGYPKCAHGRFRSDCANARSDLYLRWAHISKDTFSDTKTHFILVSTFLYELAFALYHFHQLYSNVSKYIFGHMHLVRTYIHLRNRVVWSECSLGALWIVIIIPSLCMYVPRVLWEYIVKTWYMYVGVDIIWWIFRISQYFNQLFNLLGTVFFFLISFCNYIFIANSKNLPQSLYHMVKYHVFNSFGAGLGGSVGCAVRLETRGSRVQPPPRSATFFLGDWSWNIFYGHSLPSADSRRAVVSFWRKNVHNTGYHLED